MLIICSFLFAFSLFLFPILIKFAVFVSIYRNELWTYYFSYTFFFFFFIYFVISLVPIKYLPFAYVEFLIRSTLLSSLNFWISFFAIRALNTAGTEWNNMGLVCIRACVIPQAFLVWKWGLHVGHRSRSSINWWDLRSKRLYHGKCYHIWFPVILFTAWNYT